MRMLYQFAVAAMALVAFAGCNRSGDRDRADVVRPLTASATPAVHVVVEAETLTKRSGAFAKLASADASGGDTLAIPAGIAKSGKVTGSAFFETDVATACALNLWLRVKWTGTCSNSVIVKTPGLPPKIIGESATYNVWHWIQGPPVQANAGLLKIELKAREDGIFIDQLMLTSDLERVPVGIETPSELASGAPHDSSQ